MNGIPDKYSAHRKAVWVVVVVIITVSVSGYFMGLRQIASGIRSAELPERELTHEPDTWPVKDGVPQIAEYGRLAEVNYKANASWINTLEKLVRPVIDPYATNITRPEQAAQSLVAPRRACRCGRARRAWLLRCRMVP
jgi:hypothetical protein